MLKILKMNNKLKSLYKYINFININFLVYFISFIKGVTTRKLISPEEYGLFIKAQLVLSYGSYLQLGVLNSLNFEIPTLLDKEDYKGIDVIIGSSKGFLIVINIFIILLSTLLLILDINYKLKFGYLLMVLCLIINLSVGMYENILRGYQKFNILSRIMLFRSIIGLLLTIILVIYIGYYGLYFGFIIENIVSLAIILFDFKTPKAIFDLNLSVDRIKCGFPIFLNGMLWSLLLTLGQTIGAFKVSDKEIGEFSIAILVYGVIMIFPSIISQIIYPNIIILTSKNNGKVKLLDFYKKLITIYSDVLIIISMLLLFLLGPTIKLVLPSYENGINSTLILILSLFVIGINGINTNIITGYMHTKALTKHILYSLLILVIIEYALIDKLKIEAISISLFIAFIVLYILNYYYLETKLDFKVIKYNTKGLFNFITCIFPIFLLIYQEKYRTAYIIGTLIFIFLIKRLFKQVRRYLNET